MVHFAITRVVYRLWLAELRPGVIMDEAEMAAALQGSGIDLPVESATFEGEGDFCAAYTVNGAWIVRFAKNDEATRSLVCEARLLPGLAAHVSLAVPVITHMGRVPGSGLAVAMHRKIEGMALTPERLLSLNEQTRLRCASDIARFLKELHGFTVSACKQAGVPECDYPFCRTENGITQGTAREQYGRALQALLAHGILEEELRRYCESLVGTLVSRAQNLSGKHAPVHGDLSADHILFDPRENKISGVIDFSDVIISDPLLDMLYLHASHGHDFTRTVLSDYAPGGEAEPLTTVQTMYAWYTALRLLWALDHNYTPGVDLRIKQLREQYLLFS